MDIKLLMIIAFPIAFIGYANVKQIGSPGMRMFGFLLLILCGYLMMKLLDWEDMRHDTSRNNGYTEEKRNMDELRTDIVHNQRIRKK